MNTQLLPLALALFAYFGAVFASIIFTSKSTKIRQNFFRQLTIFVGMPLFLLVSSSSLFSVSLMRPDHARIEAITNVEDLKIELESFEDKMEIYAEYQRTTQNLWLTAIFLCSIAPVISLGYYTMRRLEKHGAAEDDRVF